MQLLTTRRSDITEGCTTGRDSLVSNTRKGEIVSSSLSEFQVSLLGLSVTRNKCVILERQNDWLIYAKEVRHEISIKGTYGYFGRYRVLRIYARCRRNWQNSVACRWTEPCTPRSVFERRLPDGFLPHKIATSRRTGPSRKITDANWNYLKKERWRQRKYASRRHVTFGNASSRVNKSRSIQSKLAAARSAF